MLKLAVLTVAFVGLALQAFGLGLEFGAGRLPYLRHRPAVYTRFFLATFVIMPLVALAMHFVTAVPRLVWGGLIMVSVCPPSAGLGNTIRKLGGDAPIGQAWQASSLLLSLVTIPITVGLLEWSLHVGLQLPLGLIIRRVLAMYFIPELAGFGLARAWPALAPRLVPTAKRISGILIGLLVILMLGVTATRISSVSLRSWLFILVFSVFAVVVGALLGGPPATLRPTLATALATRWPMPVLVLAQVNRLVLPILPVLIGYLVFGVLALLVYGRLAAPRQKAGVVLPRAA